MIQLREKDLEDRALLDRAVKCELPDPGDGSLFHRQ